MANEMMNNVYELFLLASSDKISSGRIAFADKEKEIPYLEAKERTESVALYLKRKNIVRQPIIVPVDRSVSVPLLFLGIAASNNYYVPLAENTPKERLKDIIEIGEIKYTFGKEEGLISLSLEDALKEQASEEEMNELKRDYHKNNPLYLRFTSGSTGKPKGVLKSNGNVLAFVENFKETFPEIKEGQKIANQTPFSFDASAKDIYLSIGLKSTLYIPPKEVFSLPNKSVDYLNEKKITWIRWVPSALVLIARLRVLKFVKPRYLKYVFFIGEVFPVKYFNEWYTALPDIRYVNWYGSTEVSGACLYAKLDHCYKEEEPLPIGKPLKNNHVFLKDGEIIIESDQVALGYIKDKERNDKTFVKEDGKIYLHTGDFGQIDDSGNIIFRSRRDFQIKHLGYRIELQDIEAQVRTLSYRVNCCCLYVKEKIILVAVLNQEEKKGASDILQDLKPILASYRRPNRVVILDHLPLNANGKVDRVLLKQEREK